MFIYCLPPLARAAPMETSSRFSNGNTTARFWQKVTTGLFKRRLHRVLDSKRRHILTYIDDITKITSSHYDKVIHDLPTTPWSHKHADPDVCRKIFPCGREKFFYLKNANGSERSRFFCPIRGLARSAVRHRDSSLGYPRSRSITLCHISCITALDDARSATCPPREALCRDVDVSTKST